MNKFFDQLFLFCVKHREHIITAFKLLYMVIILVTLIAGRSIYIGDDLSLRFWNLGKEFGEMGIVLYSLTLIPGIFRRFGWKHKLISILMIFRRYIGITMFLVILYHYSMMRGVDLIRTGKFVFPPALFELMGMSAFFCLFLLAVTSNDVATHKLGVWWGRIHSLTYVIVWFIFLHTALQAINVWSLLIGGIGIIQVVSFISKWRKSHV